LDQRTSDIEKLPDGRTKFGSYVSGSPKVVIEAWDAGVQSFTNNDFQSALLNFQRGINAVEASKQSGAIIEMGGGVMADGEARLCAMAAECSIQLHSNNLANEFAEKAVNMDSSPQYKILLTETTANLAVQNIRSNNLESAFGLYQMAITNYESIANDNTNKMPKFEEVRLYDEVANLALYLGRTNEADKWRKTLQEITSE